jgi:hypothetical protein
MKQQNSVDTQRRALLKLGAAATIAACAGNAGAQGAPHLDEKDPQAQALGYKHDATKADKQKFANYQPGQTCATCQQFQAKGKEWCAAYVKKA